MDFIGYMYYPPKKYFQKLSSIYTWKFLVFTEPEKLKLIHTLYHREWFQQAPVVIMVMADKNEAWTRADGKNHADVDTSIAADHMTLAATDRGLGTCWVCNFDKEKTVDLLKLPSYIEPLAFFPMGYPADTCDPDRHTAKRKPLSEIVQFNSWDF